MLKKIFQYVNLNQRSSWSIDKGFCLIVVERELRTGEMKFSGAGQRLTWQTTVQVLISLGDTVARLGSMPVTGKATLSKIDQGNNKASPIDTKVYRVSR